MSAPCKYVSFLVRLWHEDTTDAHQVTTGWRGEVEHIQTGQRLTFCTVDELLTHLRQQTDDLERSDK